MTRRIVSIAVVCALVTTLGTGCIGRNAVGGKVMAFNLDVADGKWGREGVFLLLNIIPVYPIAGFVDLFVVNSIEFHSGTNPVNGQDRLARAGDSRTIDGPDGSRTVATLRADKSVDIQVFASDGAAHFLNIIQEDDELLARDAQGRELGRVSAERGLVLTDAQAKAFAALNTR